ncbi:Lactonase, 7-bladed beta-propeller-domain-containing protein [Podospora aff. communis PSN243]|uniref:Lactonase, 7-bladed beta-propeller-domain-containing protein n=1 Tax=Podospora aff. communis PSN243 TaxID=3040156 RepID=A0AAV9H304_9PEZI|nr:Lactonase, 7-bladed beta-propeller-domain-containing protein [Podospora aff. communis PSN243]
MRSVATALVALLTTTSASLVHITSYAGSLTTLNLTLGSGSEITTQSSLQSITATAECGANPGWLSLVGDILYCLDEAFGQPNGTLASFRVAPNGDLTLLNKASTIAGPVSAVVYGQGGRGLAIADYQGSGINTFNIADPTRLTPIQSEVFRLARPGANPKRQEAPHPHQAILDPTGNFLVVPDLGADLIRIFALNQTTLAYRTIQAPLASAAGSGPRHAAFVVGTSRTYFYVLNELDNTLVGYDVTYNSNSTLGFRQLFRTSTHGDASTRPNGTTAAEILVSPENPPFLILSSRFERALTVPSFNSTGSIPSDPLITFSVDTTTGLVAHRQTRAAGGVNPRHFSLNRAGTLVGVGLQNDGRAVVIQRDPGSGLLGDIIADVDIEGEVNCFVWNEEER